MNKLEKFKSFLKKLDDYEDNVRTIELKEAINKIINLTPKIERKKGSYYLIYQTDNLIFKFNTLTSEIEIIHTECNEDIEKITATIYDIIALQHFIHIKTDSVVNCYIKTNNGYNLLLAGEKKDEFFTKKGFQVSQELTTIYCPNIIFRSEEDKDYCNFVNFEKQKDGYICVNLEKTNSSYCLSSINDCIKANPKECKDYVVLYKDDTLNNQICFPAIYHHDKTLRVNLFIDKPLYQYSGLDKTPFDADAISFEGRTIEDFFGFEKERKAILNKYLNCKTTLGPAEKVIKKLMK